MLRWNPLSLGRLFSQDSNDGNNGKFRNGGGNGNGVGSDDDGLFALANSDGTFHALCGLSDSGKALSVAEYGVTITESILPGDSVWDATIKSVGGPGGVWSSVPLGSDLSGAFFTLVVDGDDKLSKQTLDILYVICPCYDYTIDKKGKITISRKSKLSELVECVKDHKIGCEIVESLNDFKGNVVIKRTSKGSRKEKGKNVILWNPNKGQAGYTPGSPDILVHEMIHIIRGITGAVKEMVKEIKNKIEREKNKKYGNQTIKTGTQRDYMKKQWERMCTHNEFETVRATNAWRKGHYDNPTYRDKYKFEKLGERNVPNHTGKPRKGSFNIPDEMRKPFSLGIVRRQFNE